MAQENLISAVISDADQTTIQNNIASLQTTLTPLFTHALTPDERMHMLKMGDKTLAFVGKALEYAVQNPAMVPAFLDVAEAQKDFVLASQVQKLYNQLNTLLTAVGDVLMLSGSEANDASLIFYASVKGSVRSNVPGSAAVLTDLQDRFPRKKTKKAAAASETAKA
jgi:hypothetical protein